MVVSYGSNVQEFNIKRVYYTESSTIYEGMPVCYEFDATTNVLGYDKGAGGDVACQSTPNTTAEGNQNEGKYIRVENPDADNIHAFAGVVAGGKHIGSIGPRWLEIYTPNGAVVPVRTDQSCTVGRTILAVHTGEQHLTGPYETAGRSVAIAWETDTDLASTTGIVLAKLDPNLFLCQKGDATSLIADDQDTGNDFAVNQINVGTIQASGRFTAFQIRAFQTAGNASSWDYGLAMDVSGDWSGGTITNNANVSGHWLNLGATTISGGSLVSALRAGIYEGGTCTFTSCGSLAPLSLAVQVTTDPGTSFSMIYCRLDGAQALDYFVHAQTALSIAAYASTSNAPALQTGDMMIPVRLGGTTYYLVAFADTGL
ncbi:hypothetical protein LCGC14_1314650 [marine sediment metagenome]|uniref:Uncharacterized protein n=1 Tax=marine sediment metagenome TaxID=412755 RepID=A0A0F9KLU3_9ZZZZ